MAFPTLTFSCDLPTSRNARNVTPTIKFGTGFDEFEVILGKAPFVVMKVTAPEIQEPSAEFNLNCLQDFPSQKVEKITVAVTPAKPVSAKGKEVMIVENLTEELVTSPSVFEAGSSSKVVPLTRSQKKNRSRKLRKAAKAQISEEMNVDETSRSEELGAMDISPLLRGSRFHPLMDTDGHETIQKIAAALPAPHGQGEEKKKPTPTTRVSTVFQRLAAKEGCSVSELLKRVGCAVSPRMKREILRDVGSARRSQIPVEISSARIPVRFRLGGRVDTAAVTTDSPVTKPVGRRPVKSRLGPRVLPSTSDKDVSKVSKKKMNGLPGVVSGLHYGEHTSLRHFDASVETLRLKASPSKKGVWIPKVVAPIQLSKPIRHSYEMKQGSEVSDKVTAVEDAPQRPPDLKLIQGSMIEDKIEKLRVEISELARERGISADNEDSEDYLEEDCMDINVIETRAATSARDAQPLTEGNVVDELRSAVLLRDEQIN